MRLHEGLESQEAVQVAMNYMPESKRNDFLENFTDT